MPMLVKICYFVTLMWIVFTMLMVMLFLVFLIFRLLSSWWIALIRDYLPSGDFDAYGLGLVVLSMDGVSCTFQFFMDNFYL